MHETLGPASTGCDNEHGDLFYSARRQENCASVWKNEDECTGNRSTTMRRKFLAVAEACGAIF